MTAIVWDDGHRLGRPPSSGTTAIVWDDRHRLGHRHRLGYGHRVGYRPYRLTIESKWRIMMRTIIVWD